MEETTPDTPLPAPHPAPRTTPTRATPAPSPPSCPGSAATSARRQRAAPRRAASTSTPSPGYLSRSEQNTLAGRRDRALLLLGFAAALRRSELVALDVEDLAFDRRRGVTIRVSKTDQEQEGTQVAVPYARAGNDVCPVRALHVYIEAAGIHRGPVFRRMRRGDTLTSAALRPSPSL